MPGTFSIRDLTAIAMAAALAVVLGLIGKALPLQLPQGGSITLETVPIFFIAFWGGWRLGVMAGLLDGILQLFLGAFIVHPVQVILDYPLAFALLGVSGLLPKRPRPGIVLGGMLRWMAHVLSGVIFFSQYAPAGFNTWLYSALYNASFVVPETLIALFVVPLLLRRLPPRT